MHLTEINYQIQCVLAETPMSLFYAKQCKRQLAPSEVFQTREFNCNEPKQSQAQAQ